MSHDLSEELKENPEFKSVIARLRQAHAVEPSSTCVWRGFLAASLLVVASLVGIFLTVPSRQAHFARAPRDFTASVDELIATQNADGSWKSDFLTRRNAGLLSHCESAAARIAYKKAMRNLRARGIL